MEQPQLDFEAANATGLMEPVPPPKLYELHGESRDGIGMLQADIIGWSWDGGVWWLTGQDGSITGYSFKHYLWLSIRPQEFS